MRSDGGSAYRFLSCALDVFEAAQAQLGHSHMATTLEIYTHASGSAQRDAVNLLEEQLFPNVPKLESCGSIAETESQLVQ